MKFEDVKKELLKDPKFRKEYYRFDIIWWAEKQLIKLLIWIKK